MRTSKKQVESAFSEFCKQHGFKIASNYSDVGGLRLDHNSVYGGWNIEQIVNTGGGITHPFGDVRCSSAEMANKLWFSLRVKSGLRY